MTYTGLDVLWLTNSSKTRAQNAIPFGLNRLAGYNTSGDRRPELFQCSYTSMASNNMLCLPAYSLACIYMS